MILGTAEARQRVVQGAALLDVHVPGWATRVNRASLNVQRSGLCVIGQLYGDWLADIEWFDALDDVVAVGFQLRVGEEGWTSLQLAWVEAIDHRAKAEGRP